MHAQFARPRSKEVAFGAHDVADLQKLVKREILLRNGVLAHVDLQALAVLGKMRETGLAHLADGENAARDAHWHVRIELFGGLVAILGQDLRDGMAGVETMAVCAKPERLDLRDAGHALVIQLVFKGQYLAPVFYRPRRRMPVPQV